MFDNTHQSDVASILLNLNMVCLNLSSLYFIDTFLFVAAYYLFMYFKRYDCNFPILKFIRTL